MGETGPVSEDPLVLNFEAHFLWCAGVARFIDKCQDMTRNLCGVRSMVGEGEMLS